MAGRVQAWTPLEGDPGDLINLLARNPELWLPEPTHGRGPGHWAFPAHAGPVERTVTCMVGEPNMGEGFVLRRLRWEPDPEPDTPDVRALPTFEGELRIRDAGEGRPEIHLDGSYRPPTGRIGAMMNSQQIQELAEAMTTNFLNEVIARLTGQDEVDEAEAEASAE